MRIARFTFGVLLAGCIPLTLLGQSDSTRKYSLDEVVISASRQEERLVETPRAITVIDRDKIASSVYNSVGDLLARQQGIYVVGANQTPGSNQSLFLRGANSNQVAILIDGVRITDPSTPNNAIDLSELSLTNVERIEIIEGAHSTEFGGAAVGGAINIITRKNQGAGLHGTLGIQAGTFGEGSSTFSPQAELTYNLGNGLYINGSFFNQSVVGLNAAIDTTSAKNKDKDGFHKTDVSFKAGYRKANVDAFVSYKRVDQTAEIDNGAYVDDDNNYVSFQRNLINYGAGFQMSPEFKVSLNGSWSNSRRQNENDSSRINATEFDGDYFNSIYHGNLLTNEVQGVYQKGHLRALLGGGFFSEKMEFNTYFYSRSFGFSSETNYDTIDSHATTGYGFAQVQLKGGKDNKLAMVVGGRLSHHSLFGNYATFEVNPSIQLTKTSLLFMSVASGFNAPSLYQLFDPTKGFFDYTSQGNENLRPETSLSFELGFKKEFNPGTFLTTSVFHNQTRNAIEYVYLWNGSTPVDQLSFLDYAGATYINLARQYTTGFEISGSASINKNVAVSANFTYLDGRLKYSANDIDRGKTGNNHVQLNSNGAFIEGDTEFDKLVRRPKVMSFTEVRYRIHPKLSISADYRYTGARPDSFYDPNLGPFGALNQTSVKAYNLVDAGMVWKVDSGFAVTARIDNIFDADYQEIIGFNTRGRSAYVKLMFQW